MIKALGFDPEDLPTLFGAPELDGHAAGAPCSVDCRTMMTSLDGVFAAGDIVRGASLVVWAHPRRPRRRRQASTPSCKAAAAAARARRRTGPRLREAPSEPMRHADVPTLIRERAPTFVAD